MNLDINLLVDKKLSFLRKVKNIEILKTWNIFQFFKQRFGINNTITMKIIKNSGIHKNSKLKKFELNIINQEIKNIFIRSENQLDIPLERQRIKSIQKNVELYNYRGSRYQLKLPLNGQRRRANGKTTKKIRF